MSGLHELTAEGAIAALHSGETSAADLVEATLAQGRGRPLGQLPGAATPSAPAPGPREIDAMPERPPLGGVPIAIKDALSTRDLETTSGSRILEGFRPLYTATCVDRLERAGAVVIGKTNMDEFAMGSSTENSAYQVTRNPWDPGRVPGGSSGGSAAAVAAFQAPWALGSDTGGSIRQPAALCGIVGMKPTYGAVSRYGLIAFASSLDQVGPFARTVRDSALLLSHIVGRDEMDSTSLDWTEPIRLPEATDLAGLRIGVVDELMGEGVERRRARRGGGGHLARPGSGREHRAGQPADQRVRHRHLLPPGAGGVLGQPRPLRRHPLRRPPRRRGRGSARALRAGARPRVRPRGQAAHHARHVRARIGVLRRLLRSRAEGRAR